jgi:single-stranded-DNA-specific exonuclease
VKIRLKDRKIGAYYPSSKYGNLLQTLLKSLDLKEEEIEDFLFCHNLELEDPFKIFGMKKAVKVIEDALKKGQKIFIHGDFDVDGVSATAILWDYLYNERKADVTPIIPHRVDEGYGLSEKTIQKVLEGNKTSDFRLQISKNQTKQKRLKVSEGIEVSSLKSEVLSYPLLITVDCGIKDIAMVEKYKDQIDFVITDHHQFFTDENGEIVLPKAKAVIHSAHPKSKFSTMISGGATAWELVRGLELSRFETTFLNSEIESSTFNLQPSVGQRQTETYRAPERTDLSSEALAKGEGSRFQVEGYLDLVALSTVCDIIPLTLENRKLIQKGLQQIAKTERLGLLELMKVSAMDKNNPNAFHFGFVLGPRLNAPGRVTNDATDALRLLATKNATQARELAQKLDELNIKRKELTQTYLEEAEKTLDLNKKALVVLGENWPEGILGLIAGKLAEKYRRPTFVGSIGEENHIIGSSRSPLDNFYLNKALEHAKDSLERFGGHKQAAGFASNTEIFPNFESKILEYIELNTSESDFDEVIDIDLELADISDITEKDIEELALLEPHGVGNTKPLFLFKNCGIENFSYLGSTKDHLKLNLNINGKKIDAIGFKIAEKYQNLYVGQVTDVIGSLSINEWNNVKKMQIEIKEILV